MQARSEDETMNNLERPASNDIDVPLSAFPEPSSHSELPRAVGIHWSRTTSSRRSTKSAGVDSQAMLIIEDGEKALTQARPKSA